MASWHTTARTPKAPFLWGMACYALNLCNTKSFAVGEKAYVLCAGSFRAMVTLLDGAHNGGNNNDVMVWEE